MKLKKNQGMRGGVKISLVKKNVFFFSKGWEKRDENRNCPIWVRSPLPATTYTTCDSEGILLGGMWIVFVTITHSIVSKNLKVRNAKPLKWTPSKMLPVRNVREHCKFQGSVLEFLFSAWSSSYGHARLLPTPTHARSITRK